MDNAIVAKPMIKAGIYYFPTYESARIVAQTSPSPDHIHTMRIVEYTLGWAIQREKSGPYWGPHGWK